MTISDIYIAGFLTGAIVTCIEGPVDLLKCKLQAQVGKGQYSGVWDCVVKLFRQRGIRALYQGATAVTLRNAPCFANYFSFFEATKRKLTPEGHATNLLIAMVAGGVAGFGFWGLFYPLDIIKTRMQTDATDPAERKYRNTLDCVKKTYAEGGVSAFYKGYVPTITRAVPVNAAIFLGISAIKKYFFHEGQPTSDH